MHPRSKFEACISHIEAESKKLHALRDAGHVAQTTDMLELMSETSLGKLVEDVIVIQIINVRTFLTWLHKVVARMYENFESQSNAIGTSLEMVNTKLEALLGQTNRKST